MALSHRKKFAALVGASALIIAGLVGVAGPAQARTELANNEAGGESFTLNAFDHNFVSFYQDLLPYTVDGTAPWATGKLGLGVVGSPTVSATGGVNGSGIVTFTGSGQALASAITTSTTAFSSDSTTDLGAVAGSDNASMQVVFKTTSATVQTLFQRIGTHSGKFTLGLDATGHVTCSGTDSAASGQVTTTATSAAAYNDGNWHTATCTHLSGEWNSGSFNGAFVATVDGTSASTNTPANDNETVIYSQSAASGKRAWFGESNAGTNQFLGSIDSIVWAKYRDYIGEHVPVLETQQMPALNMPYGQYSSTGLNANGIVQDANYWQLCAGGSNTCQVDPLKYKFSFDEGDANSGTSDYYDVESYSHDWSSTNQVGVWPCLCNAGDHLYYGESSMGTLSPAATDLFLSTNPVARLNDDDSDLTNTAWLAAGNSAFTTDTVIGPSTFGGLAVNLPSKCNANNLCATNGTTDGNNVIDFTMPGVDWDPANPQTSVPEFGATSTETAAWAVTFKTNTVWPAYPTTGNLPDSPNLFQQGLAATNGSDDQIKIQIGHGSSHDQQAECILRTSSGGGFTQLAYTGERVNSSTVDVADGKWHTIICIKGADTTVGGHATTPITEIVDGVTYGPFYTTTDGAVPNGNGTTTATNFGALGTFINTTNAAGNGTGAQGTNYGAGGNGYRPTMCGRITWSTSAAGHYPALKEALNPDNCDSAFAGFLYTTSSQLGSLDMQTVVQHWLGQMALVDYGKS